MVLYFGDQRCVALVHDQVQGRIAEDREPQEREYSGHQHDADDELADRATAAELGDEEPDKGSPGDRSAKDEQGPVADPVTAGIGLQIECALDNVVQITASILQKRVENKDRRPHQKDQKHQ